MAKDKTPPAAVEQNIASIQQVRKAMNESRRVDEKLIDRVAEFLGSTKSFYLHLLVYGTLLSVHFFATPEHIKAWNATTQDLSFLFSFEALILSFFVLINQGHMKRVEQRNMDLHLQMSLLAEHEVTRLLQVTDLIAKHLEVDTYKVPGLAEVKKDIDPKKILERISEVEKKEGTKK
jgi:uncharacterized membrane protein